MKPPQLAMPCIISNSTSNLVLELAKPSFKSKFLTLCQSQQSDSSQFHPICFMLELPKFHPPQYHVIWPCAERRCSLLGIINISRLWSEKYDARNWEADFRGKIVRKGARISVKKNLKRGRRLWPKAKEDSSEEKYKPWKGIDQVGK